MGFSAYDSIPASFADFLIAHVAAKTAQKIEQNIWNGNAASAGEFSGLISLMTADGDVVDVSATTVDASNVITQLGRVVDAIPSALYGKEDLTIYVSQNVAKAYVRALGGFGASGLGANGVDNKGTMWYGSEPLFFDGIRVAMVNGLPSNRMVAAQSFNLVLRNRSVERAQRSTCPRYGRPRWLGQHSCNPALLRRCTVRHRN
jgi:phosphotransferase system HPr-like phosphotransfer protein